MQFKQFASELEKIHSKSLHSEKIRVLSQLFAEIEPPEIAPAVYLCQGRLRQPYHKREARHTRLDLQQIVHLFNAVKTEEDNILREDQAVSKNILSSDPLTSLSGMYNLLHISSNEIDNWLARKQLMPTWLLIQRKKMSAVERNWLVQILAGPLFSDKDIVSALATCVTRSSGTQEAIEEAYKYTVPDLGFVANTLKVNGYWAVAEIKPQVGIPLKPHEIYRLDSAANVWLEMGQCYVQPKYHGWQIQIHKDDRGTKLFDRKFERKDSQLPNLVEACRIQLAEHTTILDCEVVGFDPRLGRILPYDQTFSAPSHKAFVFDLIFLDGEDWRHRAYHKRRARLLEILEINEALTISAVHEEFATNLEHLEALYERWKDSRDTQGIVAKKPNGRYFSGRKTKDKVKVKPFVSLDVLVLGYRISQNGIPSFLVGVWDENRIKLVPIGSVEGAIISPTDREILLERCQGLKVPSKPSEVVPDVAPRFWVRPQIVVEVVTDGRKTRSNKYLHAGYGLHEKTKLLIRDDLAREDADDIQEFKSFSLAPGENEIESTDS